MTGCGWTANSNDAWLTITSGANGNGGGTVSFTVAQHVQPTPRTGTLTIAGQTFTVTQAAAPCAYMIAPPNQSIGAPGGPGTTVTVTTTAGCAWTAVSNTNSPAWLTITSGATGNGNGSVTFTVAPNTGPQRTGTLTIAGQTFTVMQAAAACAYMIAPPSQSIGAAGGAGTTVTVTTMAGCAWTAVSNTNSPAWLTITSGAMGNGNGSVTFTVAPNTGPQRTGTLTIAGQTFTVMQDAAACAYMIAPQSQSIGSLGGPGTPITVTAMAGCAWTAVSNTINPAWLTITSGANGNGNGMVTFTVAPDLALPLVQRVGTLTIAGQTFTVTQGILP